MSGRGGFIFSVRQLTQYVKARLTQDRVLQEVAVRGEVADLSRHASGHLYFTLKDQVSQLRCVMFREDARTAPATVRDGMEIVCRGTVTVYEARGVYQLVVREMEAGGVGELALAFERVRLRLAEEGLFAQERKRPLPAFPRRVAVVTSPEGAAVRDVLTTLRRRWPAAQVVVVPAPVSGVAAGPGISRALGLLRAVEGLDVALLVRGGGSMEELAAFNTEEVARAIAASPVPVVAGIGHEGDVTIADLVADVRAATPTAAAAAVTPERGELIRRLRSVRAAVGARLRRLAGARRRELALLRARPALQEPRWLLGERRQRVDDLAAGVQRSLARLVAGLRARLARSAERVAALSPRAVLARGYAIARLPSGEVVRSVRQLAVGAQARIVLWDGWAGVEVKELHEGELE